MQESIANCKQSKINILENNHQTQKYTDSSKIIPLSKSTAIKSTGLRGHIAVMPFESHGVDSNMALTFTDIFTNQIQNNGKYKVMERSQMTKILSEQGFQSSGACNSSECAVEIGRMLSIENMIIGSIGKLGESWVINSRIIDVQTGEILATCSRQVIGKVENLGNAAVEIATELIK